MRFFERIKSGTVVPRSDFKSERPESPVNRAGVRLFSSPARAHACMKFNP